MKRSRLHEQIEELIVSLAPAADVRSAFEARLARGRLTYAEDAAEHFGIFFLPWRPATGELFLGHHKKSGKWLSPGGHVEPDENLLGTLQREAREELSLPLGRRDEVVPFLLTITAIDNPGRPCRKHFDVWYILPTDGRELVWDGGEFHAARWVGIQEAKALSGDATCLQAFDVVQRRFLRGAGGHD